MAKPFGLLPAGIQIQTSDGSSPQRRDRRRRPIRAARPVDTSDYDEDTPLNLDPSDEGQYDDKGNLLRIKHPDGSITISLDGNPLASAKSNTGPAGWYDNLIERIDAEEQARIVDEIITGVNDDLDSRQEWIDMREQGISLLGLDLAQPDDAGGSPDGLAVEGMSTVRHPLLLEAVLRFNANARGEMLPSDGPVKIRDDNNNAPSSEDTLANALEKDLNHFLTVTDKNYVFDTDRMLLLLGFGGTTFKKGYYDPLLNRPVLMSVDADDLIVNNNAVTLADAKRITHRSLMTQTTVRRMQLLDIYADVDLGYPQDPKQDAMRRKKQELDGRAQGAGLRPQDRDREIYETCCELDIVGLEHKWNGKPSGLPVPYVVTIDVSSRKLLAVSRNFAKPEKGKLPERKTRYVDYQFIPGLGFYGIGLVHILANATIAVTAAWREALDAGMFASFPGFLMAKMGARQNTNIFRVPPGGGVEIDTGGMDIAKAVMPLPYKTEGLPALMQLAKEISETGQRVGMTAEQNVGEGKQNAPVGTTLALIEQAQKVLSSVHKRMHAAQAAEFQLLAEIFREHPEAIWEFNKKPAYAWDEKTFRDALDNYYLVPQADPNTASQVQRIAKVGALFMLAQSDPDLYDMEKLHELAIHTLGWSNAQEFFKAQAQRGQPSPEMMKEIAELQIKQTLAQAKTADSQTNQMKAQMTMGLGKAKQALEESKVQGDQQFKVAAKKVDAGQKGQEIDIKRREGIVAEKMNLVDAAQNLAVHPESAHLVAPLLQPAFEDVRQQELEEKMHRGLGGMNTEGI